MGATLVGTTCTFRVWAPNASRVAVTGSFNAWRADEHVLTPEEDGVWSITLDGIHAGDEYLYRIDNRGGGGHNPGQRGLYRIDPWARATRHASGNGVIVDVPAELAESGLDCDPFVTPSGADWLIYQAHVGSFSGNGDGVDTGPTGTGTFAQFEQKLPYIRSLRIQRDRVAAHPRESWRRQRGIRPRAPLRPRVLLRHTARAPPPDPRSARCGARHNHGRGLESHVGCRQSAVGVRRHDQGGRDFLRGRRTLAVGASPRLLEAGDPGLRGGARAHVFRGISCRWTAHRRRQ